MLVANCCGLLSYPSKVHTSYKSYIVTASRIPPAQFADPGIQDPGSTIQDMWIYVHIAWLGLGTWCLGFGLGLGLGHVLEVGLEVGLAIGFWLGLVLGRPK